MFLIDRKHPYPHSRNSFTHTKIIIPVKRPMSLAVTRLVWLAGILTSHSYQSIIFRGTEEIYRRSTEQTRSTSYRYIELQ